MLFAWFALTGSLRLVSLAMHPSTFGFDVRLYQLSARAWLAGGDPWGPTLYWSSRQPTVGYAGPPQTLLPFLLLGWVPASLLVVLFALVSASAAIWVLRRLSLPMWWLLFPPIVEGLWVGNLNIIVIACLVAGGTFAGGLATMFKAYAAIPLLLLGRWRPLLLAGILAVVTAPFLPWATFVGEYTSIASTLSAQSWGGAQAPAGAPLIYLGAAIGLALLGRQRAAWLAVPVLWPSTQLHYRVLGLPGFTPLLAFFAAMAEPGYLALGIIVYAIWTRRGLLVWTSQERQARVSETLPERADPTAVSDA